MIEFSHPTGPDRAARLGVDRPSLFRTSSIASGARPVRPRGGTGLGLPIARWIADRHGGQLIAENRAQGGACLRFSMPGA
jgi:signal transduction histidine kinase